jgi:hypothetical protein
MPAPPAITPTDYLRVSSMRALEMDAISQMPGEFAHVIVE